MLTTRVTECGANKTDHRIRATKTDHRIWGKQKGSPNFGQTKRITILPLITEPTYTEENTTGQVHQTCVSTTQPVRAYDPSQSCTLTRTTSPDFSQEGRAFRLALEAA